MAASFAAPRVQWVTYLRDELYFVPRSGEAASEIRQLDWARTPLGEPEGWSVQLKTAVQMMLASMFPKAVIWGTDYTTVYNDAFRMILGDKTECMGKPLHVIWEEAWSELAPIAAKAFAGEATYIEDYPLVINRYGHMEQAYFTLSYSPILDGEGRVAGVMNTLIETTGKVEAEKIAAILNAELAHRIKNTFSIIQAIATQTFRTAVESEHLKSFASRLHALANAHDVLRMGRNSSGTIEDIVDGIASSLGVKERVLLEGREILIGPKGALSMSLAVHELMTNALKYGALSNASGTVSVSWEVRWNNGDKTLVFHWRESGGPPVSPPENTGFGSRLIEMGLLGAGDVQTFYNRHGFEAIMSAPLDQIQDEGRLYNLNGQ